MIWDSAPRRWKAEEPEVPTPRTPTRRRAVIGKVLICLGLLIGLGPIAIFFLMLALPKYFDNDSIAIWHIVSAYGISIYLPAGTILLAIGVALLASSRGK